MAAAVPALIDGLASEDPSIREGCASALGAMRGPRPTDAVPALRTALAEHPEEQMAIWAVGEIGVKDEATVAALTSLAGASEPELANSATWAQKALEKLNGTRPKDNPDR